MQALLLLALAAWASFVQEPRLVRPIPAPGKTLLDASLPPALDRQRDVLRQQVDGVEWALGVAAASDLSKFYVTFEKPGSLVVAPIDKPSSLLKDGLFVEVEPNDWCAIKVAVGLLDLFNPLRCATVRISAAGQKPREISTGVLLDAIEGKAFTFKHGRHDYWLLYVTDIDPETERPASTRTLLLVRFDGLGSKAWPIPESALGSPALLDLKDSRLGLSLSGGRLVVTAPR